MKITVTPQAKAYMEHFQRPGEFWTIAYEKAGCTCSEEGVFTLRLVTKIQKNWQKIATSVGDIYIDPSHELYLDKEMTIDYQPKYRDLSFSGKYEGLLSSHFIIQNSDGTQRHI